MFEKSGAKKIRSKAESQQIATYAAGGEGMSSVDLCRAGGSTLPSACRLESDLHTRMSAAPRRSPGGGRGVILDLAKKPESFPDLGEFSDFGNGQKQTAQSKAESQQIATWSCSTGYNTLTSRQVVCKWSRALTLNRSDPVRQPTRIPRAGRVIE